MDAIKAGIVLAPEDRKKDGLCTKLSIRDNIALPNLDILCNKFGVVNRKKEAEIVERSVRELTIKLASSESDAGSLSGGNQQKVVVAKWLARNSRVVIFDELTRGIDVAAKVEIYNLMNQLSSRDRRDVRIPICRRSRHQRPHPGHVRRAHHYANLLAGKSPRTKFLNAPPGLKTNLIRKAGA